MLDFLKITATWPLLLLSLATFGLMCIKDKFLFFGWLLFLIPAILQFILAFSLYPQVKTILIIFGCINIVLTALSSFFLWYVYKLAQSYKNSKGR
ncbi:hypothetical protein J2TS4_18810 [Paenibacillus sp. J2TS4]|nr:hypothetical protein J2TS4_18810 [Paenibacillus sp. J2TS4]